MRKYVYPTTEHVMEVTNFKEKDDAKAAIRTLKWLDNGAPHKVTIKKKIKPLKFDMAIFRSAYYDDGLRCGTVCCIAGAINEFRDGDYQCNDTVSIHTNNPDLRELFHAEKCEKVLENITAFEAARTLRLYLKKGIVDWSHVKKSKSQGCRS